MAGGPTAAAADDHRLDISMNTIGALTTLNFLMADVRDGLGPYLAIFLQGRGWSPIDIGLVLTIGGLAGMIATTPMGAFVDSTRKKRLVTIGAGVAVTIGCLAILISPNFLVVSASQVLTGIVGAVIPPAIAAMTLGIVGPQKFSHQIGRNEAANHGGNVVAAVACAGFSYLIGIQAVFFVMIAMAVGSIAATLAIKESAIDHDVARGLDKSGKDDENASGFSVLLKTPALLIFGVILMLFHFGNAAMLPLVGQRIEALGLGNAVFWISVAVIVAQAVMVPMALIAARVAERHGYTPLMLAALIALPVRGLVAASTPEAWIAIPVQMLDGVGAGILGVVTPALVARILRGTGRFNVGLGAVMTVQAIGAAMSATAAGYMVVNSRGWLSAVGLETGFTGYGLAFLGLGCSAALALVLFLATMRWLPLEREGGAAEVAATGPTPTPAPA